MTINSSTIKHPPRIHQSTPTKPDLQPTSIDLKIITVAKAIFWTIAIPFNPIIDFFTQGLSDFLGLETLRHGTRYTNYIGIRLNGADSRHGGGHIGACKAVNSTYLQANSLRYFHLTKDTLPPPFASIKNKLIFCLITRIIASRFYCSLSSTTYVSGNGFFKTTLKVMLAFLHFLLIPTLKFRFKPEDLVSNKFEDDKDSKLFDLNGIEYCVAYKTKEKISTDHIGLKGILTQGLDGKAFTRMKAHSVKATWGLIKLINPIGIAMFAGIGSYLIVNKVSGALFGRISPPTLPQAAVS